MTADLCETLKIPVEWRRPVAGRGGIGTIERDEAMVRDAGAVVTYVDPARTDEGGTVRIQRMGMHMNKPSWSFAPNDPGPIAYIGASEKGPSWTSA